MFDFLGLPRELRDRCYEYMLVPEIDFRVDFEILGGQESDHSTTAGPYNSIHSRAVLS